MPEKPAVLWQFSDDEYAVGSFPCSAFVDGGIVYISASLGGVFWTGGAIYAIDPNTGKMLWRVKTDRQLFSSPIYWNRRVYCGEGLHQDAESALRCIDAKTGKLLWKFQTKSHIESTATVKNGIVYIGAGGDGVYALDAVEGDEIWHFEGAHIDVPPAVAEGRVVVGTGYGEMGVYCLDAETGKEIWRFPTSEPAWGVPSIADRKVFFGSGKGDFLSSAPEPRGTVYALSLEYGKVFWSRELPDAVMTCIAYKEIEGKARVFFGCKDGKLYCLSAEDGSELWAFASSAPILSSPAVTDKRVVFGSDDGRLYCLDATSGKLLWSLEVGKRVEGASRFFSSPLVSGGRIFTGTTEFKFLCIGELR